MQARSLVKTGLAQVFPGIRIQVIRNRTRYASAEFVVHQGLFGSDLQTAEVPGF